MTTEDYKKLLPSLPDQPGVYKYINEKDEIIYVGKAKNLKKRIASYFGNKTHQAYKTRTMVRKADRLEYIMVNSEQDALLLENTLIKKNQPRYNVSLKDAKSYTYICVKKERFPRVFFTRRMIRDGSTYFGPYTSKYKARIVLDLIKNLFPVRTCSLNLSQKNIEAGKFKVCLEYHIKNCYGPCVALENQETYDERISQIKNMLHGNFGKVKTFLKQEMKYASEHMEFEKAQSSKEKLDALNEYQAKSTVVSTSIKNADVFSLAKDDKYAYVNYIRVVNGAIIYSYTLELVKNLDEDERALLSYGIQVVREKYDSAAEELIVPFEVDLIGPEISITIPQRGDKRKLLELSENNVKYFLLQKRKEEMNKTRKQTSVERILTTLKSDLQMDQIPLHIECFDNSNLMGTHPVAACVVFKNAKPSKKDYRKFNIKTVTGPDDFASMEEVVHRRYRRLLEEDEPLPQLIIIDGGKGQLSASLKSLKGLGLEKKIKIIGIAKRLEEIFFPEDPIPLYINKKSESLKLIQQLRNEAHRFAITFHRDKRSQKLTRSELETIPGIGKKTAEKLLSHFGSVKKIKASKEEDLLSIAGQSVTKKLLDYFKEQDG